MAVHVGGRGPGHLTRVQGAASVAALVAGAAGIWWIDQTNTTNRVVPNAAAVGTPPANYFRGNRRQFSNTQLWAPQGTTIVDNAAVGNDGLTEASSFAGTGAWLVPPTDAGTLSAGTYTIAAWVKRNAGTDQPFAFTGTNTGTRVTSVNVNGSAGTAIATSTWQRFSATITKGSSGGINTWSICSSDGAIGANLLIHDFDLFSGSVDLGATQVAYAGHLYLGGSTPATTPSYASGEIDFNSAAFGVVQFQRGTTVSSFTVQALVKKSVTGGASHQAFLSYIPNYQALTAYIELSSAPCYANAQAANSNGAGLWDLFGYGGYHVITHRYNSATQVFSIFIDDILVTQSDATALSSFALTDFFAGLVNSSPSLSMNYKMAGGMVLYTSAKTDAEIRNNVAVLQARAVAAGVAGVASVTRWLTVEGDSRSVSTATRYPFKFGPNSSPKVLGFVQAVSGASLTTAAGGANSCQSRIAALPSGAYPVRAGLKVIGLMGMMGANDLAGTTAAAYYTSMSTVLDAWVAKGVTNIALVTENPTGSAGHNTLRDTLNASYVSAMPGSHGGSLVNLNADPIWADNSSFTNFPADWTDSTHQSATGDTNIETYVRTVVNAI